MVGLPALWLPILLSAVAVFVVSSIIHMWLPWHKNDYPKVPDEDRLRDAVGPLAIPPGDYMVPRPASMQDMKSPEFAEKLNKGPVLILTVKPNGPFSMSKNLIQWFIYCIVVGIFAAYLATRGVPLGAAYGRVFQFVCISAFIAYTLALWQMSIWYGRALSTTIKSTVDGLIYALVTAGIFGWLWPS